jgi:hypothetical protein
LNHSSSLREVLQRARRRCLFHLLLDRSALALTVGMGGAILLLLAGTDFLSWYWVALIAVASFAAGVYRLRRTIPSTYKLAQRVDHRLNLADALSTATYFESDPSLGHRARGHEAIRARQHAEAETIAQTVDLQTAIPFHRPRFAYPAIALAAVAFGVFALRFAVTGSLSLQPSLVKVAFDHFFPPTKQMAKLDKKGNPIKPPGTEDSNQDSSSVENQETPDQMLDAQDSQDPNNPQPGDTVKESAQKGSQDEKNADVQGDNSDKGDKQGQGNDASEDNSKQGSKDGKQENAKEGKQGNENQNSSLMDKLKDAMANMLNKMKSSSKDGQQNQQQNAQNGQQSQDKAKQQGKQGQQQQAQSDAQSDQQQSDAGDKKQTADAKGSEKSSDKNASQDSKSGIGSADGDKAAKEAEQLKAMGKISEILGKRAQNVTGEVMVEVGSSKQQLKTPWAQRQAAHTEAGGEINRDEVPLIYQQFVQQYFEEIRKTPKAPKAPGKNPEQ